MKGEEIKNHTTRQKMKRWVQRNLEKQSFKSIAVKFGTNSTQLINSYIASNDEKSTLKEAAEILRDVSSAETD